MNKKEKKMKEVTLKRKNSVVNKRTLMFGIRNKITVCFLVPLIFMIVIGVSAYQKAAQGMRDKFQESTLQTIEMAKDYLDMSCSFIASEGMKYAFDANVTTYLKGTLENDPAARMKVLNDISSDMMSSKTSNSFISNIHIVTKENIAMLTSGEGNGAKGIFTQYKETVTEGARGIRKWIDSHPTLDEVLEIKNGDYFIAYEVLADANRGCVVVDIKKSEIQSFMDELDLGEGSIVGVVTENGKEVLSGAVPEGQSSVFFEQDFFKTIDAEHMKDSGKVRYNGANYLYIYSRSDDTNLTVCALIPMEVITGQAEEIKSLTMVLTILASVIVLIVGIYIVAGIQNNMKRISGKFDEVAGGDLTVEIKAKGRDEFQSLAGSATHMIANTKKLVNQVSSATGQLEESAGGVEQVSGIINDYSREITQAISDINEGIGRQTLHAQECVVRTDVLSDEIQEVGRVVEEVEGLVDRTEEMIDHGMEIVQLLGNRAKETTEITSKVSVSIESLKRESDIINSFVQTITEISNQTNLLSLNASIEAARAGNAGKGFVVVAEEIRKLADDSAKAAGEIRNNVENISAQTADSVSSAAQAQSIAALQAKAVEEVIRVFNDMQQQMKQLICGLKGIMESTQKADAERSDTVAAVKNISAIIGETAEGAEVVKEIADKLLTNVEKLNSTADILGDNMQELKMGIAHFKI